MYRDLELGEQADTLENVVNSVEVETTVELSEETWSDVVTGLNELEDMRPGWLASKIARRADLSGIEQGFSTSVPIGSQMEAQMMFR